MVGDHRVLLFVPSDAIKASLAARPAQPNGPRSSGSADMLYWPVPLVHAYYDVAFDKLRAPALDEFTDRYFHLNADSVMKALPQERAAMRTRCFNTFCSLVREHYLFALCVEAKFFASVVKHEGWDLNSKVDLVVRKGNYQLGIALRTPTRNARHWDEQVKPYRLNDRAYDGAVIDVFWSFDSSDYVGGVYLPTAAMAEDILNALTGFAGETQAGLSEATRHA